MITALNADNSDYLRKELSFTEIYQIILIELLSYSRLKELDISEDDLRYSSNVQYQSDEVSNYVWEKLEYLGFKLESYYNYPNGNGDSGLKISWE